MVRERGGFGLPEELRNVPQKVLEDYVHSRIVNFAGEQAFARRLYASPAVVKAAAGDALSELQQSSHAVAGGQRQLKLVFRHTCLSLGCLDSECDMCRQTQHRRCLTDFSPKYLAGDPMKAKCGAAIYMEVMDQATGKIVGQDQLSELHVEVCILEGKAFSEIAAETESDKALDDCTLLVNAQGRELLAPGRGSEHSADKRVVTRFSNGRAELSVSVLGSSIALLSGQKPSFRLLVRAVTSQTNQRAAFVGHAVSDAFVVATQRVKTAQKADIPHVEEHVSKIEAVGVQTQHKLQDIKAAAESVGLKGLNVVHNSITTVGQFRELVESCGKDVPLQESLRKVLNFTAKGWEAARAHVLKAVSTDNRMRIWCADDSLSTGLLFRCNMGRVDLDTPVGLLHKKGLNRGGQQVEMEATLTQQPNFDPISAGWLQQQAVECWWRPGHPGWSVWPADSEQFIRGVVEAGDAILAPVQIIAPIPACPHSSYLSGKTSDHQATSVAQPSSAEGRGSGAEASYVLKRSGEAGSASTDGHSHPEPRLPQATRPIGPGSGLLPRPPPLSAPWTKPTLEQLREMQTSWGFNIPLVNGQPMRQDNLELPQSPFDVPSTAAPASGSTRLGHIGQLDSFSFRPNDSSKSGVPTVASAQPNQLPTLTTQELEQIMEMQRRISSEMNASETGHFPSSFLTNFASEGQQDQLPQLLTRLSGFLNAGQQDGGQAAAGTSNGNEGLANLGEILERYTQVQQAQGPEQVDASSTKGEPGSQQLPMRFSGKVSGILDDLSDAMSLLRDLLPSAASDVHLQAAAAMASSPLAPPARLEIAQFGSSAMLPRSPPLNMLVSAEGSTELEGGALEEVPNPLRKKRKLDA